MEPSTELSDILAGLSEFLRAEVFPLHEAHGDVLDDPRRRYGPDGRYSEESHALIRRVREASAAAGYYAMTLPTSIGGGDIGWEGLFLAWEHIFFECGALRWLGHHAIAHWTKGPNPLLAELAPAIRDRYLPDLRCRYDVHVLCHVRARCGQRRLDDAGRCRAHRWRLDRERDQAMDQ